MSIFTPWILTSSSRIVFSLAASSSANDLNVDFKSASSVERVEAFIKLGRPDPAPYAEIDRDGQVVVVEWEHVVTEVSKILSEHE